MDTAPTAADPSRRVGHRRMLAAVVVTLTVLALVLVVYVRVGWSRMEAACSADPPGVRSWRSLETSWSWQPLGFRCTWDGGRQRTSLWF